MLHPANIGDPLIDNLVFRYSALSFGLDTPEQSASGEQTEGGLTMFAESQIRNGISLLYSMHCIPLICIVICRNLGLDQKIINHIIDHVFLPTKLPQDGLVNKREKDIAMLTFFCETIAQFSSYIPLGSVVLEIARGIIKLHSKGYLDYRVLTETFNHMSEGGKSDFY